MYAMGLPMHTDDTRFVLSPFWTPPPLLQMIGNSRSCKSMILGFTSLSHWSTCMLEVAQQLTPVSGISCGASLTPMRTLESSEISMHVTFLGTVPGSTPMAEDSLKLFWILTCIFSTQVNHQACRTSRRHWLLHWPYPLQQSSPKQVNLDARQARGQRSSTVWGALPSQICQSSFQVQTSIWPV